MEVVIHGTKGGYRILFKTPNAPSIGGDIRKNVSSEAAMGKYAFSIAFTSSGYVFTKYIIVSDSLRSGATGFIAFSLFLQKNEELIGLGDDAKSILDELSSHYVKDYIRNNSINRGETNIIQEDWSFVNYVLEQKRVRERKHITSEIISGTEDPAYVLYRGDFELNEYLSKPFQEEYIGYKQILFIDNTTSDNSSDLLTTIRNSGKELKVDLRNEIYFLNNFSFNKGVAILANGKLRSESKSSNVVRAKDKLEVKYISDYYEPFIKEGTLSNSDSELHKYLQLKENLLFINYDSIFKNLIPREQRVNFEIRNWKKDKVDSAEIFCTTENQSKSIINNSAVFQGQELGLRWTVSAEKGKNLISAKVDLVPLKETNVKLVLNQRKNIKFQGVLKTENDLRFFPDIKISVSKKGILNSSENEVEFINDEINEKYQVRASYSNDNIRYEGVIESFYPKEAIEGVAISIDLAIKASEPKYRCYRVDPGKHGKASEQMSMRDDGSDISITESKGYKFIGFKTEKNKRNDGYDGVHIAKYIEKHNFFWKKLIAVSVAGALVISLGIWAYIFVKSNSETDVPKKPSQDYIESYIEGVVLSLDTLNYFKSLIDTQNILANRIDKEIKKREFINDFNIHELNKFHYYSAQKKFETAFKIIDSSQYIVVKQKLGEVSSMNLNQISDSINSILKVINPLPGNSSASTSGNNQLPRNSSASTSGNNQLPRNSSASTSGNNPLPGNSSASTSGNNPLPGNSSVSTSDNNPSSGNATIAVQLKSSTVTKTQLEEFKFGFNESYNKSINLYLEFWNSIKPQMQIEESKTLLRKINSDQYLKSSALQKFLNSVCSSEQAFKKYNDTAGKKMCKSIQELSEKIRANEKNKN